MHQTNYIRIYGRRTQVSAPRWGHVWPRLRTTGLDFRLLDNPSLQTWVSVFPSHLSHTPAFFPPLLHLNESLVGHSQRLRVECRVCYSGVRAHTHTFHLKDHFSGAFDSVLISDFIWKPDVASSEVQFVVCSGHQWVSADQTLIISGGNKVFVFVFFIRKSDYDKK